MPGQPYVAVENEKLTTNEGLSASSWDGRLRRPGQYGSLNLCAQVDEFRVIGPGLPKALEQLRFITLPILTSWMADGSIGTATTRKPA